MSVKARLAGPGSVKNTGLTRTTRDGQTTVDVQDKIPSPSAKWPIRITRECAESIKKTHGALLVEVAVETGRLEIIEEGV